MEPNDDFYVEDEPVEDVLAAFGHGHKALTMPPDWDRKLTINYAFDGVWHATSPDLPWLDVTGPSVAQTQLLVREVLNTYVDDTVIFVEWQEGVPTTSAVGSVVRTSATSVAGLTFFRQVPARAAMSSRTGR